jgi:protein-disulfide isomerase
MRHANSRTARRAARTAITLALLATAGCAGPPQAWPDSESAAAGGNFRALGRARAPVTVIEFTDLQCPHCARFAMNTFPELRRLYVDTGKVRFESRDLPLPFHPYAIPAAVAARCAGEQGKYWEYRELLAVRQTDLPESPYDDVAGQVGLDRDAFNACRADGRQIQNVRQEAAQASAQGISVTPSFVIGRTVEGPLVGETIEGAEPLAVFEQKIEALLKQ